MAKIKQAHKETENLYYATEKMLAVAKLNGYVFDDSALEEAGKRILLSEFHDILRFVHSGRRKGRAELLSAAKKVTKDYRTNAFLHFAMNEKKAGEEEYPIFVFNYMPYAYTALVEAEFTLANQNRDDGVVTIPEVYEEEGNKLPL